MTDSRKQILDVNFAELENTNSRIKDKEVNGFIKNLIDKIKKTKNMLDEKDIDQNKYYTCVSEYIAICGHNIKETRTDDTSKVRAKCIIERFKENIAQFAPQVQNNEIKEDLNCYTLAEQQAWLSEDSVKNQFENALEKIKKETSFELKSLYISHAFADSHGCRSDESNKKLNWIFPFLTELRRHLIKMGFLVSMLPDDSFNGGSLFNYMKNIETDKYVLLIGSPMLLEKHNKGIDTIMTTELNLIRNRYKSRIALNRDHHIILPLICGDQERSYPTEFALYKAPIDWVSSQNSRTYFQLFRNLLKDMFENDFENIWKEFLTNIPAEKAKQLISPPKKNTTFDTLEVKNTMQDKTTSNNNELILKKLDNLQAEQGKLLTLVQQDSKYQAESTQKILNKIDEAKSEILNKVDEIDSIIYQISKNKSVNMVSSKSLPEEASLSPKLRQFNTRFKTLFSDFLSIAKHVSENKIQPEQKNVELTTSLLNKLMNLIPLPYMGLIANLLTSGIKYVDQVAQKSDAKKANHTLGDDLDVISVLAFKITSNYQRQIEKLSDKGIDTLAECARKRVVHFMLSLDEKNLHSYTVLSSNEKVEFLFLGVAKGKSSKVLHNHLETLSLNDRKWTDDGIFLRSGWELPDGTKYICIEDQQDTDKATRKTKKYGFHLGNLNEKKYFENHHFKFLILGNSKKPTLLPIVDRSTKPKGLFVNVNGST